MHMEAVAVHWDLHRGYCTRAEHGEQNKLKLPQPNDDSKSLGK